MQLAAYKIRSLPTKSFYTTRIQWNKPVSNRKPRCFSITPRQCSLSFRWLLRNSLIPNRSFFAAGAQRSINKVIAPQPCINFASQRPRFIQQASYYDSMFSKDVWMEGLIVAEIPKKPMVAVLVHADNPVAMLTHVISMYIEEATVQKIFAENKRDNSYVTRLEPHQLHAVVLTWTDNETKKPATHGVLAHIVQTTSVDYSSNGAPKRLCVLYPLRRVVCNRFDTYAAERFRIVEISNVEDDPTDTEVEKEICAIYSLMADRASKMVLKDSKRWPRDAIGLIQISEEFTLRVVMQAINDNSAFFSLESLRNFGRTMLLSKNKLERYRAAYKMLCELNLIQEINKTVALKVEIKLRKQHEEMAALEKIRILRNLLGQAGNAVESFLKEINEQIEKRPPPEHVLSVIQQHLARIADKTRMPSVESTVTCQWLKYVASMPWNVYSEDRYDVLEAEAILNEDHYGLEEVKERVLQFIAICQRTGEIPEGKTLLLVGPPGTGKTSITASIARALNRKYIRLSAATNDANEIRGFRRTYHKAQPGIIVDAIQRAGTLNPVIVLDEIDKMGRSHSQGDPAAALLEVLDPMQNKQFLDHYLDVPIDLSKVLFICTANSTAGIPAPLLDRMQCIEVSGYVPVEKLAILNKYILPRLTEQMKTEVILTEEAKNVLVERYSMEHGVRQLTRAVEMIVRKVALRHMRNEITLPMTIRPEDLQEYCGPPTKFGMPMYDLGKLPVGVVAGVAYVPAASSGSVLMIETIADRKSTVPRLHITGQLSEVMKESTQIAYIFAKSFLAKYFPENKILQTASLHIHFPSGESPKDGPSAGISIATSIISVALNKPVAPYISMTGEITLTGQVLAIGGVRDKVVAAKLQHCTDFILPLDNKANWEELPSYIREGINVHFVTHYEHVFEVVFGKLTPQVETELATPHVEAPSTIMPTLEPARRPNAVI